MKSNNFISALIKVTIKESPELKYEADVFQSSVGFAKVMGVFLLFCININVYSQSDYKQEVISLVEQAKQSIAKKDYITARRILDGSLVYGVHQDTIEYYKKVVDYNIDLDSVYTLYMKKYFQDAKDLYNQLCYKYQGIITTTPAWVLRCDTIIEAQKNGHAITREMARNYDYYEYGRNKNIARPKRFHSKREIGLGFTCYWGVEVNDRSVDNIYIADTLGNLYKTQYKDVEKFSEGLCEVKKKNGKKGYMDAKLDNVIKCEYMIAKSFHEGLALVCERDDYLYNYFKYIDKSGNVIINELIDGDKRIKMEAFPYDFAYEYMDFGNFSEGLAYNLNENCFFDKKGVIIFRCARNYINNEHILNYYSWGKDAFSFSCGRAKVLISTNEECECYKYGFIDKTGKEIVPLVYDEARSYSEGLAAVRKGKKWGFIDLNGNDVTRFEFDDARSYSEGLATVKKGKKWGFIDLKGNVVIPFDFDAVVEPFRGGFAVVYKGHGYGLVDKYGISTFDYK